MLHIFEGTISTQTICNYSGENICLFSHSFILSFTHLYYYAFMDIYVILWVIIQCCIIYLVIQIVTVFAFGSSFSWLLHPYDITSSICFLSIFLLFGTKKYSKFVLYILCASPRTTHFSRSPGFFYWRNVLETKIWALGLLIAPGNHCFYAFQLTTWKYTNL